MKAVVYFVLIALAAERASEKPPTSAYAAQVPRWLGRFDCRTGGRHRLRSAWRHHRGHRLAGVP